MPLVEDRRAVLILMFVLVFLLLQVPNAYSSESTAEDKIADFLSSVVGLDLTKYTLVPPSLPPGVEYPSNLSETLPPLSSYPNFTLNDQFGGLVEEEVLSYDIECNESKIHIMGIFYNGHMAFLEISPQSSQFLGEQNQTNPPDDQPLDEQKQVNPLNPSTLAVAVSIVAAPIVLMTGIALGHKNWHKQRI